MAAWMSPTRLRDTGGTDAVFDRPTFQSSQLSLRQQPSGNQDHQKSKENLSKLQFHGKRSSVRVLNQYVFTP